MFDREVESSEIQLVKIIGIGRFSVVWEGLMFGTLPVAVKVLKPEKKSAVNEFLKKAAILKILCHPKIVHLCAVCTKEPIYIVLEFMKHGSLLEYLRGKGRTLRLPQLINIAAQIAQGMAFLEERSYVHRDLAARNVLVGENLICKVADFHLAQAVRGGTCEAPADAKVAIKWTAPEAARNNRFSIKSDVWAFGILLYEIVTFGRHPYPDMTNTQVLGQLQQGYRMPRPMGCPDKLYDIMLNCWREDPDCRPTFETLQWQLEQFFN